MEIDAQCQHLTSICTHTIMQCVPTRIAPTFMQTDTHSTQIKYTSGDYKNGCIFQIPSNTWFFVLSSFSIYPFDLQFSFDIVLLGTHTYCPLHHTHPLYFWVLGAMFRGAIRSRVNTWTRWHWVLSHGDVNHVISTSFSMSYWWHRAQCPGLSMSWTLLGGDAKSCQLPFNCQVEKF